MVEWSFLPNRIEMFPLRYEDVYRLKRAFPHLPIEINGGVTSLSQIADHLHSVDAVMIGRAAYDQPWLFSTVDSVFFERGILV